jgi:juvenile hormone diol kinase
MLTEFQKRKLSLRFYMIDASKDGIVELSDFELQAKNVAELRGVKLDSPEYQQILSAYTAAWESHWKPADTNSDNKVTVDEYLKWSDTIITAPTEGEELDLSRPQAFFDSIDADGSGDLDLKEYTIFLKAVGRSEEDAKIAFSKIDTNGDGKISRYEFAFAMNEYHASNDPEAPGNWFFGSY